MRSRHSDPGSRCQWSPTPKVALKERRKEIIFSNCSPAGHLTLTPTDDTEEHPVEAAKRLTISCLLFPQAAPAHRRRAILSPCDHYSSVTTRDAALLSECDRFQTRGCSVSSLRHILLQTLPSKEVSGLTLCSSFHSPRDRDLSTGEYWLGGMQDNTVTCLGILFCLPFYILGYFHLKQMRTANSEEQMEGFSVIRGWKNPLGKADRWGLTCGPSLSPCLQTHLHGTNSSHMHIYRASALSPAWCG